MRSSHRPPGVGIDARRPGRFTSGVHDGDVVADDEPDLDHREHGEDHQRQHECELDRALPALGAVRAHGYGTISSMTSSNSRVIALLPVAQVTSSVATAAAPRITSAYSAVVWPASARASRGYLGTSDDLLVEGNG